MVETCPRRVERTGGAADLPTPPPSPSLSSFTHAILHHALARPDVAFTLTLHTRGLAPVVAVAAGVDSALQSALATPADACVSASATSTGVTADVVTPLPPAGGMEPRVWVSVDGVPVAGGEVAALFEVLFKDLIRKRFKLGTHRSASSPHAVAAVRLTTPADSFVLAPGVAGDGGGATVWTPPAASFGDARAVAAAVWSALSRAWHTVAPASWLPDPVPVSVVDAAPASPPRRRKHWSAPARVCPLPLPPPTTTLLTLADVGLPDPLTGGVATFPGAASLAAATVLTQLVDAAAPRVAATFCVARTPTGAILLVDPHAANERVRLEELTASVLTAVEEGRGGGGSCDSTLSRAALTPPVTLTSATPADVAALERYAPSCIDWGWRWHGDPPRVTATPVIDGARVPPSALLDYARSLAASSGGARTPAAVTVTLASRACRGAVMFGAPLPRGRVAAVVARVARTGAPAVCAHGRPTAATVVEGRSLADALAARRRVMGEGVERVTGRALVALLARKVWVAEGLTDTAATSF